MFFLQCGLHTYSNSNRRNQEVAKHRAPKARSIGQAFDLV